jgi:chemotaxis protein CheD
VSAMAHEVMRVRRYLQPGQLWVAEIPMVLTTILGSCVAVCLWDSRSRIGGMNHFMLPQLAGNTVRSPRFGNVAMQELLEKMIAAGARLPFLHASVFGGSCMFAQMQSSHHLGQKNIQLALDFLSLRGIDIVQTDVGGERGRKLRFHTDEGTTWLNSI